ncbi:MAG: ATP-dependent DNA helicase PcrA, partial [Gemmatimonadota bacterium]|nr:ATP-dependent DNA helicase PcrA [Gemmatimonadota bacterium]
KDVLAYLKLVVNPRDSISFWRVINTPRRGIGTTSTGRLDEFAMREGLVPYEALANLDVIDAIPKRTAHAMQRFYDMVEGFRVDMETIPADELAAKIVDETSYLRDFEKLLPEERMSRRAHVAELLTDIQIFVEQSDDVSLEAYLRKVSLVTDVDQWENAADAVTLMTLHSAKGLEFPIVFVTGLEEGLFPILRPAGDEGNMEDALEEERRLFYVGITRAQDRLFLSYAMRRQRYGGAVTSSASQFLSEIPEDLLDAGFKISEVSSVPRRKTGREPARRVNPGEPFLMDVGSWVVHPAWGRGQIQNRAGSGQTARLKVRFDGGAVKTLMVKFANLQPG